MTEVREAKELRPLAKEPLKWTKSLEEEEMPQVSPETRRQGWTSRDWMFWQDQKQEFREYWHDIWK